MLQEILSYISETKPGGVVSRLKAVPHFWVEIESWSKDFECSSKSEQVYLYSHQIKQPKCKCGKPKSFNSIPKGYYEFCNSGLKGCVEKRKAELERRIKTMSEQGGIGLANPKTKKRQEETLKEKYDIINPGQMDSHKQMMKDDNPMSTDEMKIWMSENNPMDKEGAREKKEATMLREYGVLNGMNNPKIVNKMVKTRMKGRTLPEVKLYNSLVERYTRPIREEYKKQGYRFGRKDDDYQIDHIISKKQGHILGILPWIIGSRANIRAIKAGPNRRKHAKFQDNEIVDMIVDKFFEKMRDD